MARSQTRVRPWIEKLQQAIPKVQAVARSVGLATLSIAPDTVNATIRVVLPEGVDEPEGFSRRVWESARVWPFVSGPACYPYQSHLQQTTLATKVAGYEGRILDVSFDVEDLAGLARGYQDVARMSKSVDFVVTFALGGLPALHHVTSRLRRPNASSQLALHEWLESCRKKFHLFPGLSWDGGGGRSLFQAWLHELPAGASVGIFDTTLSGNAVNAILNALEDASPRQPLSIAVVGIWDATRGLKMPRPNSRLLGKANVRVSYHGVPKILTEDRTDLIRAAARTHYVHLQPGWQGAYLKVTKKGRVVHWRGTTNLSHDLNQLIDDRRAWGKPWSKGALQVAEMAAYQTILSNIRQRECNAAGKALSAKLISSEEYVHELRLIEKLALGARKQYSGKLRF